MNCKDFSDSIIDIFYQEISPLLATQASAHRAKCPDCELSWQNLALISQKFQVLPQFEPTQLSLNKIIAYASEKAIAKQNRSWTYFWKSAFSVVALLFVGGLSYFSGTMMQSHDQELTTASNTPIYKPSLSQDFPETSFKPSLGEPSDFSNSTYQLNRFLPGNVNVSNVSQSQNHFNLDDELDQKILTKNLNPHELETLYYRARKFEKLGQYREALNDFEFISKFYPQYENSPYVLLSMARCLQNLQQKDDAVTVLNLFKDSFGANKEIDTWIDQLKSETL